MWRLITSSILLVAFFSLGIIELLGQEEFKYRLLILLLSGFVGLLVDFFTQLQKHNLSFYFWWLRWKNKLRNYKAKWSLFIRFSGKFNEDIIKELEDFILSKEKIKGNKKIIRTTNQSIEFSIDDTIRFEVIYEPESPLDSTVGDISFKLFAFEIGCNDAEEKLNSKIVPLLEIFRDFLRPQKTSYTLDVDFQGRNPFYALYIEHLKPEQIDDFNVNLVIDEYTKGTRGDNVSIKKDKVNIVTSSSNSLALLAKDFIFLSPAIKKLVKA